ncbi:rod shape-determining protein MreC [Vibrio sp. 10N.286.49.C2]|uniref:rod shape-determining protein MreC n=1 Tax=unclassified Vibrio TaxID=2614977 RepID=UPI000C816206|nr:MULTISPECIES: rod shape-determining protein MreC [unclassified Vibrio]PMH27550.1 rod shape-determining protein MreC [Vibrio sp. 10N.286.49.C2]PMH52975.1 rod shape-determining protein MreC [Vibrio sp. 10N.286.49.B1]PMH83390.1 rod shape-determining protein MreC [Vibrio sp. 10N.286.48.B7]
MKPIFGRGPSLQLRLFLAVSLSAGLMLADSRLDTFSHVRYLLNSVVAPIQYTANLPRSMFDGVYERFNTRQGLAEQNINLKREVLRLKSDLILLDQYREENQRFRDLLGSSFVRDEKKMVTEVMAVDTSPYRHQVVIDKGKTDGVYEGQPVINENGIVGQVTFVGAHNSRIMLLTDSNSAIPVQVIRNDIRVIASGNGLIDEIQLEHIPTSTDIQQEDLLVTSGLGGIYPEGYPVAYVKKVQRDNRREFASIIAEPVVDFDRLRYLLLIWPNQDRQQQEVEATLNAE